MANVIHLKKNAEIADLIALINSEFSRMVENSEFLSKGFDLPGAYETGQGIFDFLKSISYKPDRTVQIIKTPYRLVMSKEGDCKSFSVFAAAVLFNLGYPIRFVYTSDQPTGDVNHVFVQYAHRSEVYTLDATICCFDKIPPHEQIYFMSWMQ